MSLESLTKELDELEERQRKGDSSLGLRREIAAVRKLKIEAEETFARKDADSFGDDVEDEGPSPGEEL